MAMLRASSLSFLVGFRFPEQPPDRWAAGNRNDFLCHLESILSVKIQIFGIGTLQINRDSLVVRSLENLFQQRSAQSFSLVIRMNSQNQNVTNEAVKALSYRTHERCEAIVPSHGRGWKIGISESVWST